MITELNESAEMCYAGVDMNQVTIKRISTDEPNVSLREVSYDIYVNGEYVATRKDINDALSLKAELDVLT